MGYFNELNNSINKVLELIFDNQNLCKLLYYSNDDPLSSATISNTRKNLLMSNVFPLPKNPDAEKDKKALLNVYFYNSDRWKKNSGFRKIFLCFDIMCHLDVWMIDSAVRPYSISNELDETFNNQQVEDLSINKILSDRWVIKKYSDYYYGYHLTYQLSNSSNVGC